MTNLNPFSTVLASRRNSSLPAIRGLGLSWLAAFTLISGITGCVTVNVNFPESAVQKATDDYVRDLYRAKAKGREEVTPGVTVDKTSSLEQFAVRALASLDESLLSSAQAGGIEAFKVKTPKTESIQARMSSRVADVLKYKRNGVIGETSDGKLVVHDAGSLKPIERKKVDALVMNDNSDRDELYQEVMSTNSLPDERKGAMQASFARSFQAESPSKTWVQDPNGTWAQKP